MPSILRKSKAKAALAVAHNYTVLGAAHELDTTNPHIVTKIQIGLGNVDNTTDLDKPVSVATTTAISDAIVATDLQDVYNNSITPEILTDLTRGALTVQEATANDTASVYEGKNNAGSVTFKVNGSGEIVAKGIAPTETVTLATVLDASSLPVSDPLVAGQVWSNSGILTVSSG